MFHICCSISLFDNFYVMNLKCYITHSISGKNFNMPKHSSGSSKYFYDEELFVKKGRNKTITCNIKPDNDNATKPTICKFYRLNKSKVRSKLMALFSSKQFHKFTAFYSISFPCGFKDDYCFEVMNKVLTRLRKKYNNITYLWVSERQKNGTLHFHMVTPNFFNIRIINYYFAVGIKNTIAKYDLKFINFNHKLYNGCDVRRVYSKSDLISYITKYVTKNNEKFTRLPWNCSINVSRIITCIVTDDPRVLRRILETSDKKLMDISNINTSFEVLIEVYIHKNLDLPFVRKLLYNINSFIIDYS